MNVIRCPICERPVDPDKTSAMPFCSERCRLRDLQGWLDEDYGLPYEGEDEPENEPGGS